MAKYLDSAGLQTLWSKIVKTFLSQSAAAEKYLPLSGGIVLGDLTCASTLTIDNNVDDLLYVGYDGDWLIFRRTGIYDANGNPLLVTEPSNATADIKLGQSGKHNVNVQSKLDVSGDATFIGGVFAQSYNVTDIQHTEYNNTIDTYSLQRIVTDLLYKADHIVIPEATTSAAGLMSADDKQTLNDLKGCTLIVDEPTATVDTETVRLNFPNQEFEGGDVDQYVTELPAATSSTAGVMTAADKAKLDGIAEGADKYTLPAATDSVLGGVKTSANITNRNGTISIERDNVVGGLGYTPATEDAVKAAQQDATDALGIANTAAQDIEQMTEDIQTLTESATKSKERITQSTKVYRNLLPHSMYHLVSSNYGQGENVVQNVYLEKGKTYTLMVRGYIDAALKNVTGGKLVCYVYDNDWSWSKTLTIDSLTPVTKSFTWEHTADSGYARVNFFPVHTAAESGRLENEPGHIFVEWAALEEADADTASMQWSANENDVPMGNLLPELDASGTGWSAVNGTISEAKPDGATTLNTVSIDNSAGTGDVDILAMYGLSVQCGCVYCLSMWVKGSGEIATTLYNDDYTQCYGSVTSEGSVVASPAGANITLTSEWRRVWVVFTVQTTNSDARLLVARVTAGSSASVCGMKLERQGMATEYGTSLVGITEKITAATTAKAGLMSAADKAKLDGITESADAVSIAQSLTSGTKIATININGTGTDLFAPSSSSVSGDYLPLSGGTLSGNLTVQGEITASGEITAYATSDVRKKKNLAEADCLALLKDLGKTYEFDYKDTDKHSVGFIAQNLVDGAFRDLVATDNDGFLKVDYWSPKLIATAIGAIGQLVKEVEALKAEINELKAKQE